jgi:hypothetical protein
MISNVIGLLIQPKKQWQKIADAGSFSTTGSVFYTLLLALLPAVAWYYGATVVGWTVGDGDIVKLTQDSGRVIIPLFYITMVLSIIAIGLMIHWMASTYGSESSSGKGIAIAGFAATPMFIAGAIGFMPIFWLALVISIIAMSFAVYLLYTGITIVMAIPEERGFLFASAVLSVCMVILMVIMGGSVILWDIGAAPTFTD